MAHQSGWIELYGVLEQGGHPSDDLVRLCKSSRTIVGGTILHWYALEGTPSVLHRLIQLGFSPDVQNDFGKTPIMEAALIGRWDNARVLLDSGADLTLTTSDGVDFFGFLDDFEILDRPSWALRNT